jgi:hypothetical protein
LGRLAASPRFEPLSVDLDDWNSLMAGERDDVADDLGLVEVGRHPDLVNLSPARDEQFPDGLAPFDLLTPEVLLGARRRRGGAAA